MQQPKPTDNQPGDTKPGNSKPADANPVETKPAEVKPVDNQAANPKPAEAKPVDTKPGNTKPADALPAETKPAADAKPGVSKPPETKPVDTKNVDTSKPMTTIQVRLPETGGRIIVKLNETNLVRDLRLYMRLVRPEVGTSFTLHTTFPNKELTDELETLKDAGVLGAAVLMRYSK